MMQFRKASKTTLAVALAFATGLTVNFSVARAADSGSTTSISEGFTPSLQLVAGSIPNAKFSFKAPASGATSASGHANLAVHPTALQSAFTMSVDAQVSPTSDNWNDFSAIFGYVNSSNYWFASFNESNDVNTNGLFQVTSGVQRQVVNFTPTITAGTRYAISVTSTGSTVEVKRDGVLVGKATATMPSTHRVGVGSRNDAATFDNLRAFNGVLTSTSTTTAPTTTTTTQTTSSSIDSSWSSAWSSGSHETLRTWFNNNVKGPSTTSGTHSGGSITTQAQADALIGKVVTGPVTVSASVTLRDFIMRRSVMTVTSGTVKVQNVWFDAQKTTTSACGFLNIKGGYVDLYRVKMSGIADGIRTTSSPTLTTKYLYIHDPATTASCNGHHDGIQVMGGSADVQRSFIDMTGGPSSGQGVLVKADSADIKTFKYNYSFLTGGGNSMTFEPTLKGFPDTIDISNMLVAKGFTRNLFSIYLTNSTQTAMITKYSVKASPSGKIIGVRNGITASDL